MYGSIHTRTKFSRSIRVVAFAVAAFTAFAAAHEALLALERIVSASAHTPAHHDGSECAFCRVTGTPTLLALQNLAPLPFTSPAATYVTPRLSPVVRDESCFPHLRRAPPALPVV